MSRSRAALVATVLLVALTVGARPAYADKAVPRDSVTYRQLSGEIEAERAARAEAEARAAAAAAAEAEAEARAAEQEAAAQAAEAKAAEAEQKRAEADAKAKEAEEKRADADAKAREAMQQLADAEKRLEESQGKQAEAEAEMSRLVWIFGILALIAVGIATSLIIMIARMRKRGEQQGEAGFAEPSPGFVEPAMEVIVEPEGYEPNYPSGDAQPPFDYVADVDQVSYESDVFTVDGMGSEGFGLDAQSPFGDEVVAEPYPDGFAMPGPDDLLSDAQPPFEDIAGPEDRPDSFAAPGLYDLASSEDVEDPTVIDPSTFEETVDIGRALDPTVVASPVGEQGVDGAEVEAGED